MGITLPIELPITLTGGVSSRGVTLPITLPLSFPIGNENEGYLVKLPLTLPMSFTPMEHVRSYWSNC